MSTKGFGCPFTRASIRRMATSLAISVVAPTMAFGQATPPPAPTPELMMRRICADHDAHFVARMAFLEAKLALKAEQRSEWEAFVGAMRAAEKPIRDMCQSPPQPPSPDDPVAQLEDRDRGEILRAQMQDARRAAVSRLKNVLASDQRRQLAEVMLRQGPQWRRFGPPGPPSADLSNHPRGFGAFPPPPPPPPR